MKKKYTQPVLEIIILDAADIIMASGDPEVSFDPFRDVYDENIFWDDLFN